MLQAVLLYYFVVLLLYLPLSFTYFHCHLTIAFYSCSFGRYFNTSEFPEITFAWQQASAFSIIIYLKCTQFIDKWFCCCCRCLKMYHFNRIHLPQILFIFILKFLALSSVLRYAWICLELTYVYLLSSLLLLRVCRVQR